MRRMMMVVAAVAGVAALVAAGVAGWALYNLNSLIARNQSRIVSLASGALGRTVSFDRISARAGWGVWAEIAGLKVGDDSAFSQTPFLTAPELTVEIDLLPILRGRVQIHALTLVNPEVRLIEDARGNLNIDSIGSTPGQPESAAVSPLLATFFVRSITIESGTIRYSQIGRSGAPIEIRNLAGEMEDFGFLSPFNLDLKFALFADARGVELKGKIGPLLHDRQFDQGSIPMDLAFNADAVVIDRLKSLVSIGTAIPPELSIPDPISIAGWVKGRMDSAAFDAHGELTAARVAYAGMFAKAAKTPMDITARGTLNLVSNDINLQQVRVRIADFDASLTDLAFPAQGPARAHVETNSFDLARAASTMPAAKGYRLSGKVQMRGTFALGAPPSGDGSVTLNGVSIAADDGRIPGVSGLDATIVIKGTTLTLGPATLTIGSGRATAQGAVSSFDPLRATYQFDAQSVRPAAFAPGRPRDEVMNNLRVAGTASGSFSAPMLNARIVSSDGMVNRIPYRNLDVTGGYGDGRLTASPLKAAVFSGTVAVSGWATTDARPRFQVAARMNGIDLEQMFHALDPDTQRRLRGLLSGDIRMTGAGGDWNAIRPTLAGSGALSLADGKIAGVNIVALAINKIAEAPGVNQIVNATFMSDHRGMLADPDTELKDARMTFVLADQRITTHDLTVKSRDYSITGDGWFDLDNDIGMSMDITLTFGLSVSLPVYVRGRAPVLIVIPDIPKLAERIAMGAISVPGKIIRGGVSGLNSLIGGKSSGSSGSPGSSGSGGSSIPNPLDKLKGLLP